MNTSINDFTEANYIKLIKIAKNNYIFIDFTQYKLEGKNIIWRHDIDFSVHRAFTLAQIEAEQGVFSTFFVNPHSEFYNIFEKEITLLVRNIIKLGHKIGLHFDSNYYVDSINVNMEENILFEKHILERTFDIRIDSFSFHNPDVGDWLSIDDEIICGMINTYSKYLKKNYDYCSDSNGYWRYRRLEDVLAEARCDKLHVLTHPGWWTPEPISPRERITRCIEGRAQKSHLLYDQLLDKYGRKNIK